MELSGKKKLHACEHKLAAHEEAMRGWLDYLGGYGQVSLVEAISRVEKGIRARLEAK